MPDRPLTLAGADLARLLSEAAQETLTTMFSTTAEVLEAREVEEIPPFDGISGVVGLGGAVRGSVVVQVGQALAVELTKQMTGGECDPVLCRDTVGELGNIVAGGLKKGLDAAGVLVQLSVPTVVEGSPHRLSAPGECPWTRVRLRTSGAEFAVATRLSGLAQGG